nr:putative minor structural protein [Bat sapovirus BtSY2]
MGSWVTGAMLGASAAGDMLTGMGNLVLSALNYSNQVRVQNKQLELARQQLELLDKTSNPVRIFQESLSMGLDPTSARQLAGSNERRYIGAVPMPPITNQEYLALNGTRTAAATLASVNAFVSGVPRGQRVFNPPNFNPSHRGSVSSLSSMSTLSSSLSTSSGSSQSVVSYGSLPGRVSHA